MSKPEKHVVLISGGASGIGQCVAERFIERGDSVHICDVAPDLVADFLARNPGATGTVADIGNREHVDRVFADLEKHHKRIDVLVNNAGIAGPSARVEEHDEDGWDKCVQVNLSGTFYVTRRAVPLMRASGSGSIINVSSTSTAILYARHTRPASGE
jgi:NAD(P)-dependent dehydrogenase (short-subunit alcohol dehydrogenase family)